MKKLRIMKPLMVATTAMAPLSLIASCSNNAYSKIAETIKQEAIELFILDICRLHRATWDCGEAAQYIKSYMRKTAKIELAGEDHWSKIAEVQRVGLKTLQDEIYPHDYWDGKTTFSSKCYNEDYGNMWFDLPATEGHENDPYITLQSHYDMYLEFDSKRVKKAWDSWSEFDIRELNGGVEGVYDPENEIIKTANELTPLGADNGLGVALMLILAKHTNDFEHGRIRLLFTVDESASTKELCAGADLLRYDQLYGQYPEEGKTPEVTLDGDKPFGAHYEYSNVLGLCGLTKGVIYSSSSGIHDCLMSDFLVNSTEEPITDYLIKIPEDAKLGSKTNPVYKINISGLHGGHSSEDIDKGYANAIKVLASAISDYSQDSGNKLGFHILDVNVPQASYSIPKEATVYITSSAVDKDKTQSTFEFLKNKMESIEDMVRTGFPKEKNVSIQINEADTDDSVVANLNNNVGYILNYKNSRDLCIYFNLLLYGPISYFIGKHGNEVLTSQNIEALTLNMEKRDNVPGCNLSFHVVIRSASEIQRAIFSDCAHGFAISTLEWVDDNTTQIYDMELPIWEFNEEDKLVSLTSKAHSKLGYKSEPKNLHGWVEIACIPEIYKQARQSGKTNKTPFISCFGPTIDQSHSLKESVYTDTMGCWIRSMLYILDNAKELK